MSKQLNFNNVKKQYLTITLADKDNTTIMIGTPTKALMDQLMLLQSGIEAIADGDADDEILDDLYFACAKIMSRNKGGVEISKELLEEIFDFEDIIIFFNAYINFVTEFSKAKN